MNSYAKGSFVHIFIQQLEHLHHKMYMQFYYKCLTTFKFRKHLNVQKEAWIKGFDFLHKIKIEKNWVDIQLFKTLFELYEIIHVVFTNEHEMFLSSVDKNSLSWIKRH